MTMNVFEGARRIAKLIAAFIVIGFGIAIVTDSSHTTHVDYLITGPGESPLQGKECGPNGRTNYKNTMTRGGRSVFVNLCFQAKQFRVGSVGAFDDLIPKQEKNSEKPDKTASGPWDSYKSDAEVRMLIPYYADKTKGVIWGDEPYSQNVKQYVEQVTQSFQIPERDEDAINGLWWPETLKKAGLYFLGMLASLAGFWAFTWTVGWIVRGFMGIPRGSDHRA